MSQNPRVFVNPASGSIRVTGVVDFVDADGNLLETQERLTDSIADLYREVCHRGWGNPELDPRTISVMIQAYSLGRVVDDFTPERMDQEKWEKLITTILEQVFFPSV